MMKRGLVSNGDTCGLVDKCKFPLENCKHPRARKEGRKPLEDQDQDQDLDEDDQEVRMRVLRMIRVMMGMRGGLNRIESWHQGWKMG